MKLYAYIILAVSQCAFCIIDKKFLRNCTRDDMTYQFTECDKGGRWRVLVPKGDYCKGYGAAASESPYRYSNCSVSCGPGTYFNLSSLECASCPAGTYSLGGGLSFDSWETLPPGFQSTSEVFHSSFSSLQGKAEINENDGGGDGVVDSRVDCASWTPRGDFISSSTGPCVSTLRYTAKLVTPGALEYTYQYTDENVIFEFQAQNEQCRSIFDSHESNWPPVTQEEQWKHITVNLHTGLNILQWKTIGVDTHRTKPVLIKLIRLTGVAYTSECSPCRAGTFSQQGSSSCIPCPRDQMSHRGAAYCLRCNSSDYAPVGSSKCISRPLCNKDHFYSVHTPCDEKNQTKIVYNWTEPKVCHGGMELPATGVESCPPCSPGMHYVTGAEKQCSFCPRNQYSDGTRTCNSCPPGTAPNYAYQYSAWTEGMPGLISKCSAVYPSECTRGSAAWVPAGNYIHTGRSHGDSAYLLLSLTVSGFQGTEGVVNGRQREVGRIHFAFELKCQQNCEFLFMESSESRGAHVVRSWLMRQRKQSYSYMVTRNDTYTFTWAFTKIHWDEDIGLIAPNSRLLDQDIAIIYFINITNTVDGGASSCLPCPTGGSSIGCVPCPPGHYMSRNRTVCLACPKNTIATSEGCQSCGQGLVAKNFSVCGTNNCTFVVDNSTYDLSTLQKPTLVTGQQLFTVSGTRYFHQFYISLCGSPPAECRNNVSSLQDSSRSRLVSGYICRSTLVPPRERGLPFSSQAVSLGDQLIGVSKRPVYGELGAITDFNSSSDLHFYYTSTYVTSACPKGHATVVTIHCDPEAGGSGRITTPAACPGGTCDGCHFHFQWSSKHGCPKCTDEEYQMVRGECIGGKQRVHYIAPPTCQPLEGKQKLPQQIPCTQHIPRFFQLLIIGGVVVAILLCCIVCLLYGKHRSLEYKYMKLVATSNSKGGEVELPAAESCALEDGEDEDGDTGDRVLFAKPSRHSSGFFPKIKAFSSNLNDKDKDGECIQLRSEETST